MIEITNGFTSISAGSDNVEGRAPRSPTGARVTLEFRRETALAPAQMVTVRYEFAGDGRLRQGAGIAKPIRKVVRWGHAVVYDYRVSHWIEPSAVMSFVEHSVPSRGVDSQSSPIPRRTNAL